MVAQISFGEGFHKRNPDVLTCIANLSNDEVFTPPTFANQMLDTLTEGWAASNNGESIWSRSDLKFLDPFSKSGVFLREIVKRLNQGLESQIPDLQKRIDHILFNQVYGMGITSLTALLTRRSLYCSKWANGKHSIATSFESEAGNIWFEQTKHEWIGGRELVEVANIHGEPTVEYEDGKCKFCGASKKEYGRAEGLEKHAYAFIHTNNPHSLVEEAFGANMQFDVIVGNPPYQLSTEGFGAQARPIYQDFVEQAIKLEPRFILMVTPSRWFVGGMGLDKFRNLMLENRHLRKVVDFIRDKDAFPGVNINGGVSYFLWEKDYQGDCEVTTVEPGLVFGKPAIRPLDEFDLFIRRNQSVPILRKVINEESRFFNENVQPIDFFKIPTKFHGAPNKKSSTPIKLYGSGAISWINRTDIGANLEHIDSWKVLIPQATDGNETYPLPIWNQTGPFIAAPGEVCSFTYLVAFIAKNERQAKFVVRYMQTKFFRFLVSLRKGTQHNKSDNFKFVPDLSMTRTWSDIELFEKYGFSKSEREYIDSIIRTMEWADA